MSGRRSGFCPPRRRFELSRLAHDQRPSLLRLRSGQAFYGDHRAIHILDAQNEARDPLLDHDVRDGGSFNCLSNLSGTVDCFNPIAENHQTFASAREIARKRRGFELKERLFA